MPPLANPNPSQRPPANPESPDMVNLPPQTITPEVSPERSNTLEDNPVQGDVLDLEDLLNLAVVDAVDVESAAQWWDNHASPNWISALDRTPLNGRIRLR